MGPLVEKGKEKESHKDHHKAPGSNGQQAPQKGNNHASSEIPENRPESALIQWAGSNDRPHNGADCRPDDRRYNSISERAQGGTQDGITAPQSAGCGQQGSANASDQCPNE